MSYRRLLWDHRPLTDFWRVGQGYSKKLEAHGLYTMGDIARCSIGAPSDFHNEDLLYKLFGVNAELLIDHAWGWEPCTIADIKAYKPNSTSMGAGQVLQCPYTFDKARLVVREMADRLALDLLDQGLVTDQLVLTVGYDRESLGGGRAPHQGEVTTDRYGRSIPKHAHGTANLDGYSSSAKKISTAVMDLYDHIVDNGLLIRRLNLVANRVIDETSVPQDNGMEQLDLFTDQAAVQAKREQEEMELTREKRRQEAVLSIQRKYGKNAILKGTSLEDGATAMDRNRQIGGHRA